jgi:hypothetical protein
MLTDGEVERVWEYLHADQQMHLASSGKWLLDRGKFDAAVEQARGLDAESDPDGPPFYCLNCGHRGDEVDFMPTDGRENFVRYLCPECESSNVFPRGEPNDEDSDVAD